MGEILKPALYTGIISAQSVEKQARSEQKFYIVSWNSF